MLHVGVCGVSQFSGYAIARAATLFHDAAERLGGGRDELGPEGSSGFHAQQQRRCGDDVSAEGQ